MSQILIADDDFPVLTLVEHAFVEAGHQVLITTHPREVTELLAKNPIDAVILDVVMPDLTGWDLLGEIRARPRWRSLPVLLLSGLADTEDRVRGLKAGADDYVSKPFDPVELVARVERLIDRRTGGVGLEGNLEDFAPGDVTQNLTQGTKTGCLRITGNSRLVEVHFLRGRIIRAVAGGLRGIDAILALLGMSSGHFVFETTPEMALESHDTDSDLQVNSIFLQAAWLEDELLRRQAMVPALDQCLVVQKASLGEVPEEFAELPFVSVYQEIQRAPGVDVQHLMSLELAAPSRIILTLVLMIEQGVVGLVAAGAGAPTGAERFGAAGSEDQASTGSEDPIGDLVAACQQRGYTSETLHLLVLFQPAAWEDLLRLVEAMPDQLLSEERSRLLEELRQRGSGTVRLAHDQVSILLNLKPLRGSGKLQGGALLTLAAGVILWLTEDLGTDVQSLYEDAISQRSVGAVLMPKSTRTSAPDSGQWRIFTEVPSSMQGLVKFLL